MTKEKSALEKIKEEIEELSKQKGMNLEELKEWKIKLNKLYNSYNNITGEKHYTLIKL